MTDANRIVDGTAVVIEAGAGQEGGSREPGVEDLQVLSRLLAGLLLLGGDELMRRLQDLQRAIDANPDLLWRDQGPDQGKALDPVLDLVLGLYMRGQRRVVRGARRGVGSSLQAANWLLTKADRWTDNRLARPFRRRVAARLGQAEKEVKRIRWEGRLERQQSRLLATATVSQMIDDLMAYISDDPEFNRVIQEQFGRQSKGVASVFVDNARTMTVATDNLAERVLRRLLRLTPRPALPQSPFEGKPQTMYALDPESQARGYDEP